jgi:hypothetical protein
VTKVVGVFVRFSCAAANANLTVPLWRGASVEYSRNVPLANTRDYDAHRGV